MQYVVTFEPNFNPYFPVGVIGSFDTEEKVKDFVELVEFTSGYQGSYEVYQVSNDVEQVKEIINRIEMY